MSDQTAEALTFLDAVFGTDHPGLHVQLWSKRDGSRYFERNADAAEHGAGRIDLYVGAALSPRKLPRNRRTAAEDAAGIGGLWIDVDVNGGPQEKRGYAPDREAALELVRAVLEPTLLVDSGYGVQAWWLLPEPWIFASDEERAAAAKLAHGFQERLRQEAGFRVDSTQDLARVMRLPGTLNGKGRVAVPVVLQDPDESGPRTERERLGTVALEVRERDTGRCGEVAVDPQARPPAEKFVLACEVDEDFEATWNHTRRMPGRDQSPSAYDMSLAGRAVRLGWTDQEVCDLLVAHRRRRGADPKRPAYYRRTIGAVHVSAGEEAEAEEQEEALTELETLAHSRDVNGSDPARRERTLHHFNRLVGGPGVKELVQDGRDPDHHSYRLVLEDGRDVPLGNAAVLLKLDRFRQQLMVVTGHVLRLHGKGVQERWHAALQALLDAATVNETDGRVELVAEWAELYVGEGEGIRGEGRNNESIVECRPFVHDDRLHVHLGRFKIWLFRHQGERITRDELRAYLVAAGWERVTLNCRSGGSETSRSYYVGWPR